MKYLKKISPIEFRLHNKVFFLNTSPVNYFTFFKLEFVFQKLIWWFYTYHGFFLYLPKFYIIHEYLILNIFFYKTFKFRKWFKKTRFINSFLDTPKKKKNLPFFIIFWCLKKKKIKYKTVNRKKKKLQAPKWPKWFYKISKSRKRYLKKKKKVWPRYLPQWKVKRGIKNFIFFSRIKNRKLKKNRHFLFFKFFFSYFCFIFFKKETIILIKLLYYFFLKKNRVLRKKFFKLLKHTFFLPKYKWKYDFVFLTFFGISYCNFSFILPILVSYLKVAYKHNALLSQFFTILKLIYYITPILANIRLQIHGPFNRHGRTQFRISKIGTLNLSTLKYVTTYDYIQCPTYYGMVGIKLYLNYLFKKHEIKTISTFYFKFWTATSCGAWSVTFNCKITRRMSKTSRSTYWNITQRDWKINWI